MSVPLLIAVVVDDGDLDTSICWFQLAMSPRLARRKVDVPFEGTGQFKVEINV